MSPDRNGQTEMSSDRNGQTEKSCSDCRLPPPLWHCTSTEI